MVGNLCPKVIIIKVRHITSQNKQIFRKHHHFEQTKIEKMCFHAIYIHKNDGYMKKNCLFCHQNT